MDAEVQEHAKGLEPVYQGREKAVEIKFLPAVIQKHAAGTAASVLDELTALSCPTKVLCF